MSPSMISWGKRPPLPDPLPLKRNRRPHLRLLRPHRRQFRPPRQVLGLWRAGGSLPHRTPERVARERGIDINALAGCGSGPNGRIVEKDVLDYAASVKATPLAEKVAAENGVELRGVTGTGVGGRITREDLERAEPRPPARSDRGDDPIHGNAQDGRAECRGERAVCGACDAHHGGRYDRVRATARTAPAGDREDAWSQDILHRYDRSSGREGDTRRSRL